MAKFNDYGSGYSSEPGISQAEERRSRAKLLAERAAHKEARGLGYSSEPRDTSYKGQVIDTAKERTYLEAAKKARGATKNAPFGAKPVDAFATREAGSAHSIAAGLHKKAADLAEDAGDHRSAEHHRTQAQAHATEGAKHHAVTRGPNPRGAAAEANASADRAMEATAKANAGGKAEKLEAKRAHYAAAGLHRAAAAEATKLGDTKAASEHAQKAMLHEGYGNVHHKEATSRKAAGLKALAAEGKKPVAPKVLQQGKKGGSFYMTASGRKVYTRKG